MKSKQISLEERRGSQDRKSSSLPPYILESKLHEDPLLICPTSLPQDPILSWKSHSVFKCHPCCHAPMYISRADLFPNSRLLYLVVYLTLPLAHPIPHMPKSELLIFPSKLLYLQPFPSQVMATLNLLIVQARNFGILFDFYLSPTSRYHLIVSDSDHFYHSYHIIQVTSLFWVIQ